jgi:hypothetical protein
VKNNFKLDRFIPINDKVFIVTPHCLIVLQPSRNCFDILEAIVSYLVKASASLKKKGKDVKNFFWHNYTMSNAIGY